MNTFAATSSIGARPTLFRRKAVPRLDEEAKIFLVGELAMTVFASLLAVTSWFLSAKYDAAWALWQARVLAVAATWPVYLIMKAWFSNLLFVRDE